MRARMVRPECTEMITPTPGESPPGRALKTPPSSPAQQASAPESEAPAKGSEARFIDFFGKGDYFGAMDVLQRQIRCAKPGEKSGDLQALAQVSAIVGDVQGSLKAWDDAFPPGKIREIPEGTQPRDALHEIVEQARGRQIVILNEAHHISQTRAFGDQVAQALRKIGFTCYAAETFSRGMLKPKAYVSRDDGFYTCDPVFAEAVHRAQDSGYRLVPYESESSSTETNPTTSINAREEGEVNNLVGRILAQNPKEKIFLYCGFSHVTRSHDVGAPVWMAERLKQRTGIDPLTIDQTVMTEHSSPTFENAAYQYAEKTFGLKSPTVLQTADGKYWSGGSYANKVDMQVFHPRTHLIGGRPDWLFADGYRHPMSVKASWLPTAPSAARVLVQAFRESDPPDAVAVDQAVFTAADTKTVLALPQGRYRIVVQNEAGHSQAVDTVTQP